MKDKNSAIADIMLENLTAKADNLGQSLVLQSLWVNDEKYLDHVAKRIKLGEIVDAYDYQTKTFAVLAAAETINIAIPENEIMISGKMQIESDGWVVLLGNEGKIITSYPFDAHKTTFESRHINNGDTVYEHTISDRAREILKRIFG